MIPPLVPRTFFVWSLFQRFKDDAGVVLVNKRGHMAAFLLNAPHKKDIPGERGCAPMCGETCAQLQLLDILPLELLQLLSAIVSKCHSLSLMTIHNPYMTSEEMSCMNDSIA